MGAKVKEVGGGTATPVANEFNNFLMQQLGGGGNRPAGWSNFGPGSPGWNPVTAATVQQQSNAQQPQQQSQTGFQNAFQNAISGQVQDNSGAGGALQNFFKNPNANNLNLPQFQNQFVTPQFRDANLSQLPTNFGAGQTGMANLSGFGNTATANTPFNAVESQFTPQLQGLMNSGAQNMNNFNIGNGGFSAASNGAQVQMDPGMDFRQAYDALGQDPLMERNRMKAVADMRARFGAEGAGSLGTGAQVAEGNLNAELAAQDASMRRGQSMQLMGQDLANRSAIAGVGLQNRGQDMQTSIANMQGGLQGAQNMTSGFNAQNNALGQMLGAAGQARGQDFNAQQNMQQLMSQQGMFNAGQQNTMQQNMLGAALQNQGMGNQFGLGAAGLNNSAMQNNNLNNMNMTQFQNTFNQNNANSMAQFGQANNALNSQNMTNQAQINNQMLQSMIGQGLNMNQLGNSNMMGALAQLFGAFGQANQLGNPQAQTIQQPSPWAQGANMLGSLAGSWLAGGGGNPFGGGGGGMVPRGGSGGGGYSRPVWG
jgi:hypothetical protein